MMIESGTVPKKIVVGMSEKGLIAVIGMAVFESVVLTAIMKNYSIEVSGEVTDVALKGSMKLQPTVMVENSN